ncbi:Phosphoglycerate mutase 1 [Hondaea fermentalgiana]|uniref:phosphoglycerate mutase (2,3-diphosphoglycerate-dependent) n=1 Tax=Hondaea fermentalgiana TaxID=2315210 RepID=A0A2R5G0M6_9STRA|nr:Phosphoglycerate mutase 1 [Hondaea fermentalgiana]|eukprot:GBG24075.1 Phosphoglycerate mutase 1 [Hondaea fermentalgiana]
MGRDLSHEEALIVYRAKRLFAIALITFIVYAAFSAWRIQSVEEYQDALLVSMAEDPDTINVLSELYATSTGLMYLNYSTLFIFSFVISVCAWRGVNVRDRNLVRWHIGGSLGCIAVLVFTFVNLGIVGDLCTSDETNCATLQTVYAWSLVLSAVLSLLYCASATYAWRIASSPAFDIIEVEHVRVAPKEILSSGFWMKQLPVDPVENRGDLENGRVAAKMNGMDDDDDNDSVPYATPVVPLHHTFDVPWEHATTAFWCKYPHPDLQHVKDALVLDRTVDDQGRLHTTRLMCVQQSLPSVLKPFAGNCDSYYAIERSTVDPARKTLVLETRNLTFGSILHADETCTYKAATDGSDRTEYTWEVECGVQKRIPFVQDRVEDALVNKAKTNSAAGLSKMDEIVSEVHRCAMAPKGPSFRRWPTRTTERSDASSTTNVDADAKVNAPTQGGGPAALAASASRPQGSMLVLMRHGQSMWNRDPSKPEDPWKYAGAVDVPLSHVGIQQAMAAGANLRELPIDIVYCSMLVRAQTTALIALATHEDGKAPLLVRDTEPGNKEARGLRAHKAKMSESSHQTVLPVYCSHLLNERSFGYLQGMFQTQQEKEYSKQDLRDFRRTWTIPFPGGESQAEVYDRTVAFFEKHIRGQLEQGQNIVVIVHGFVIRALLAHILNLDPQRYTQEMELDLKHDPKSLLASENAIPRVFEYIRDASGDPLRASFKDISERFPVKAKL